MLAVLRRELMAATSKSRGERMWVGTINTWPISPWGGRSEDQQGVKLLEQDLAQRKGSSPTFSCNKVNEAQRGDGTRFGTNFLPQTGRTEL